MTGGGRDDAFPRSAATALVAYALDMAKSAPVDRDMVDRLTDEVCANETERLRLISAAGASQDPEVPILLLELLGRRLARLVQDHAREVDRDEVVGVWSQRLAASGMVASIGFVATGILTGGLGALAVAGMVAGSAVATWGRSRMKDRARVAKRACDDTERLIELIRQSRARE